jgi:sulfite reductase (NADPH) flavoprotein alpha-component
MFTYFGYGSNIDLISLKAKGVEPISSTPGKLKGWRLKFNVQHWFKHEGGVGNIEPSSNPNDVVEGLVHECLDEHLPSLDALEAYGIGYDRIEVDVETEKGTLKAYTYIGLPDFIDNNCLPTQRYLNIITRGAEKAGLSKSYIENLKQQPIHSAQEYPEFTPPSANGKIFTKESLSTNKYYTALAGFVFDMQKSREQLHCLIDIFGGKDMTLFHLKRLDKSDGSETWSDVKNGRISLEGKRYINAYLNEYAKEFKYIGSYINTN